MASLSATRSAIEVVVADTEIHVAKGSDCQFRTKNIAIDYKKSFVVMSKSIADECHRIDANQDPSAIINTMTIPAIRLVTIDERSVFTQVAFK